MMTTKNNKHTKDKVLDCYWCDVKIKPTDKVEILPGKRGVAHIKCSEEFYAVKSIV